MKFQAYRYYKQKQFQPNQIAECFQKMISNLDLPDDKASVSGTYNVGDNTNETKDISINDLRTICEIKDRPYSLAFSYSDPEEKYGKSNIIIFHASRGVLQLGLNLSGPESSETLFKIFEEALELEQISPPEYRDKKIEIIEERLNSLEERLAEGRKQLTCFLSYRFNSRSKAIALELMRFLELLEVNVVSGAGYEPRRVDEKVIARLEQPLDFLIYLITQDGESTWTRDELAYSLAKGYAVVLLVESGAEIGKSLLGNWEYLEFERDHIGNTFVGILEAIHYIKQEKVVAKKYKKG